MYVACIDEQIPLPLESVLGDLVDPIYIDGADPSKSGLARYMNSLPKEDIGNNVSWRKQRYGPQAGRMHFYTTKQVNEGDELCFEYGSNYWDAVQET